MIWGNLSTSRSFITSPKTFLLVRSIAGSHSFLHTERPGETVSRTESLSLQSNQHLELSSWADGTGLGVLVTYQRFISGLLRPQLTHCVGDDLACVRVLGSLTGFYEHTQSAAWSGTRHTLAWTDLSPGHSRPPLRGALAG